MTTPVVVPDASLAERVLVVHCRRTVVIVPLSADATFNDLLRRVSALGGCVVEQRASDDAEAST